MNTPESLPQTPASKSLIPSTSDKAAVLAGTPLAIVCVLLFESYTHTRLDTAAAVGVGAVGATVLGYVWHVVTVLIDRAIARGESK